MLFYLLRKIPPLKKQSFETEVKKLRLAISTSDISIRLIVSHTGPRFVATSVTNSVIKHLDMSPDGYFEIFFLRLCSPQSVFYFSNAKMVLSSSPIIFIDIHHVSEALHVMLIDIANLATM